MLPPSSLNYAIFGNSPGSLSPNLVSKSPAPSQPPLEPGLNSHIASPFDLVAGALSGPSRITGLRLARTRDIPRAIDAVRQQSTRGRPATGCARDDSRVGAISRVIDGNAAPGLELGDRDGFLTGSDGLAGAAGLAEGERHGGLVDCAGVEFGREREDCHRGVARIQVGCWGGGGRAYGEQGGEGCEDEVGFEMHFGV